MFMAGIWPFRMQASFIKRKKTKKKKTTNHKILDFTFSFQRHTKFVKSTYFGFLLYTCVLYKSERNHNVSNGMI